jgi:hypothetical protein
MAETAIQNKVDPSRQSELGAIEERPTKNPSFERTFSFRVKNPNNVDIRYNTRSYSADLNLSDNDVARHVHGVLKSSKNVLPDGTTEFTLEFAKGFAGSATVRVNGKTTTLTAKSQVAAFNEVDRTANLGEGKRTNVDLSSLKQPKHTGSRSVARDGFKISSNVEGITVADVDKEKFAAAHETLTLAKSRGISIRLSNYTPGEDRTAVFQAYMKTKDSAGRDVEIALGKTTELSINAADYKEQRNAAMAQLARKYLEHEPKVIASRAPGVPAINIDYNKTPDSWQRINKATENGVRLSVAGRTTINGRDVARIEARFPNGTLRSTYMSIADIGSNSQTAYTLASLSQNKAPHSSTPTETIATNQSVQNNLNQEQRNTETQSDQRETSPQRSNLRIRSVPGMPTVDIDPNRNPQLAAIVQTAKDGGLDLVRVKQDGNNVSIRLWSERLKKYAPGTFTIPKSSLQGGGPISSPDMTKLSQEAQRLGKAYEWLIVDYPGTGATFKQTVRDSLAQIPTNVIDLLIKDGQTIHLQKIMSQRDQGFSSAPRGWSTPGWSEEQRTTENLWDRVGGVFKPSKNEVVINETTLNSQFKHQPASESRLRMVTLHEVGHALGHALGHQALASGEVDPSSSLGRRIKAHGISSAEAFSRSYMRDIVMIPGMTDGIQVAARSSETSVSGSPEKDSLSYFLQAGDKKTYDAGMSETFAQSFEVALVGKESKYHAKFTQHFPQTLVAMSRLLDGLKKGQNGEG